MKRILITLALLATVCGGAFGAASLRWVSPNHYRVLLVADQAGLSRKNTPAVVTLDLRKALTDLKAKGTFDKYTIEVVAYDASGQPKVFDASRKGYEQFLLPCRVDEYFKISNFDLHLVLPDENCKQYAVYFDTKESKLGKPFRYPGLVGDGDFFREDYKRREIGGNHFDHFVDWDRDGDLDLFKGGVETYVYCYENVGGNHYVDRGRLTNDGKLWSLPQDKQARSWVTLLFDDWDGDGDLDFFPSFAVGYSRDIYKGNTWIYENTTKPGGPLKFTDRGALVTVSGKIMGMLDSFSGVTFVDLDGDGKRDVLVTRDSFLFFHKNVGPANKIGEMKFTDGVTVKANGAPLIVPTTRFDCADIDSDGDYDLFTGSQHGYIYWFENIGSKTKPVFGMGRVLINFEYLDAHSGVKVADFDRDGLLDIVAGRYWERTRFDNQPRFYGCLYKNVGTKKRPKFKQVDADHGAPYTMEFQKCDAVRQNRPRVADWDRDGKTDLIVGDTDGYVWYFRNTTSNLFPIFSTGERMLAGGKVLQAVPNVSRIGYARPEVVDWNNDGVNDLIVCAAGYVKLYMGRTPGLSRKPTLDAGRDVMVGGKLFYAGSGALVCDWDNDGKRDLVYGESDTFFFARNEGTDSSPVLAEPRRILFGPNDKGDTAFWQRPGTGSYVDWDGDGKKDFIMSEFEHMVRFLKNTGPGSPPEFADPMGVVIIQPVTGMLVSGADAKDWNGDGDLDIITGQGHGGSGIRYYERGYVDDFVNKTAPVVTVGKTEKRGLVVVGG